VRGQSVKHIFAQKVLHSPIYSIWLTVPDAEEKIVQHVQSAINRDVIRNQLRDFLDNETTERWNLLYKKYRDPKDAWYS
jgi:hypothetical protein